MCEPVTLGVGAGLLAAGTLGGGILTADAQGEQAAHDAQLLRENANLVEGAAHDAANRGEQEVGAIQRRASQLEGAQLTGAAANGIDLTSSSFEDLVRSSAAFSEIDVLTARNNARREAWGLKTEASNMRREAEYALKKGQQAQLQTFIGTAGKLASSGSSGVLGSAGGATEGLRSYSSALGVDMGRSSGSATNPFAQRPRISRG